MTKSSTVRSVETLSCDAGWRNYHFVKITTEDGIVGWSEYDEGFGAPGLTAAIARLSARVVGKNAFQHERIYAELFSATRLVLFTYAGLAGPPLPPGKGPVCQVAPGCAFSPQVACAIMRQAGDLATPAETGGRSGSA